MDHIKEVAKAMSDRRLELINRPIARIWEELAKVADDYYQPKLSHMTNSFNAMSKACEKLQDMLERGSNES